MTKKNSNHVSTIKDEGGRNMHSHIIQNMIQNYQCIQEKKRKRVRNELLQMLLDPYYITK